MCRLPTPSEPPICTQRRPPIERPAPAPTQAGVAHADDLARPRDVGGPQRVNAGVFGCVASSSWFRRATARLHGGVGEGGAGMLCMPRQQQRCMVRQQQANASVSLASRFYPARH